MTIKTVLNENEYRDFISDRSYREYLLMRIEDLSRISGRPIDIMRTNGCLVHNVNYTWSPYCE